MADNPYRTPNTMPEAVTPKHRSFRLTGGACFADSKSTGTLSGAIRLAMIQQLPLLFLASLILDRGAIFTHFLIAAVGYWIAAMAIIIRRRLKATKSDIMFLKWGYLPLVVITCILSALR